MALVWECRDDAWGPADIYVSVAEFLDMCKQCFGVTPDLRVQRRRAGTKWLTVAVDPDGKVVLQAQRRRAAR